MESALQSDAACAVGAVRAESQQTVQILFELLLSDFLAKLLSEGLEEHANTRHVLGGVLRLRRHPMDPLLAGEKTAASKSGPVSTPGECTSGCNSMRPGPKG